MIGKNVLIYGLFILSVPVLCWLGFSYINRSREEIKYTASVEHTYRVIISAQYCEKLLLDAESKQRGFFITGDDHFKTSADLSVTRIDSAWNALRLLTVDNSKQRVNLHLLKMSIDQRLLLLKQNFDISPKDVNRVQRMASGQLLMDKIHVYISAIEEEEGKLLVTRNNARDRYQALNFNFVKYAFLFACLICVAAVFLIIRELKTRIRAQKLLEKTVLDLKRSNEEVEQITFAASHDLQEPLRKIRTLSTLFAKKMSPLIGEEEKDILGRIERATGKMQLLINDLVDFTVLLNTQEEPSLIDLDQLCKNAFEKYQTGEKSIKLNMHATLPRIKAHKQQLTILFTQLIDNAIKYREPSRELVIDVRYRITDAGNFSDKLLGKESIARYHVITISDNGTGFDNAFREKIFQIFQQLHAPGSYTGKGMGLAMVRRIMTNHYGYIEANGNKGNGASFCMYFPLD